MIRAERRQEARLTIRRPAKVQCLASGRYLAAQTCNLSEGGAMIVVEGAAMIRPGQRVAIAIADHERMGIVRKDRMLKGTVLRCLGRQDGVATAAAVQFDQRQVLAMSA